MEEKPIQEETPNQEEAPKVEKQQGSQSKRSSQKTGVMLQQIGLNMLMVGVLILLGFVVWQRFFGRNSAEAAGSETAIGEVSSDSENSPEPVGPLPVSLTPLSTPIFASNGILRSTNPKTIIPSRPRVDVITYTVQAGDTLFSIAQNFSLKPETVLWGNFEVWSAISCRIEELRTSRESVKFLNFLPWP